MTLALYRYQLPFTQPLTFHGKVEVAREGLLVRVDKGWGEIAPLPGFSRESLAEAQAESLACLAQLARLGALRGVHLSPMTEGWSGRC